VLVIVITLDTPSWRSPLSAIALNSGGYPMAPVATIVPCPFISRGTDAIVPMPPGLVRTSVAPANSSATSLPIRARETSVSY
jgi:hypothetical protein